MTSEDIKHQLIIIIISVLLGVILLYVIYIHSTVAFLDCLRRLILSAVSSSLFRTQLGLSDILAFCCVSVELLATFIGSEGRTNTLHDD